MHSYLSLSHAGCRKTPSENPMGDLCGDMWYGWGKEKKNPTTHVLFCAIRGTSLLPSSETWPHAEICSLSLGFLKKKRGVKKWPLTVSHFCTVRHQILHNSHRCCWKSWCCSGFVPGLQRRFYNVYTLQRLSINYSPYNLKWKIWVSKQALPLLLHYLPSKIFCLQCLCW